MVIMKVNERSLPVISLVNTFRTPIPGSAFCSPSTNYSIVGSIHTCTCRLSSSHRPYTMTAATKAVRLIRRRHHHGSHPLASLAAAWVSEKVLA
jgi:hypothetical protein